MNIDTFQLATGGVGPGFTTYSFATVGYSVEVVPTPPGYVSPWGSGGTGSGNIADGYVPYHFREKVKVKVTRDGLEWEEEFCEIDMPAFLRNSETVEATFIGVKGADEVTASATFIKYMINTDNVIIKVKKL